MLCLGGFEKTQAGMQRCSITLISRAQGSLATRKRDRLLLRPLNLALDLADSHITQETGINTEAAAWTGRKS